ncbi:MAG TPA: arsenate reductase (glutaredoxin) [Candidatus Poseidoniales archaeon]|jgi:arsenate reductase|nr:arsenate reductase (glutaredoxin) [Candidatus Poseidoniales archaeon]
MPRLYHNPSCSKSQQTITFLTEKNASFTEVRYLETPPSVSELLSLISRLKTPLPTLIRTGEDDFHRSGVSVNELHDPQVVANLINEFPILLQRPIYDDGEVAVIGRPPEDIFSYYSSSNE